MSVASCRGSVFSLDNLDQLQRVLYRNVPSLQREVVMDNGTGRVTLPITNGRRDHNRITRYHQQRKNYG